VEELGRDLLSDPDFRRAIRAMVKERSAQLLAALLSAEAPEA
jgi:hypothetical protein